MRWTMLAVVFMLSIASTAKDQKTPPLTPAELADITARGRLLAEYDQAAWHATDAVMSTHPKQDAQSRFACRKVEATWTCVFGRLAGDKLLIDYEAVQGSSLKDFQVKPHSPPAEDTGFFFAAVKAMMTAGKDFQLTAEKRPYNPSALPASSDRFYVYIVPAQTRAGIYPLGGDARYLVSADGNSIVEKRQLHKTILETNPANVPAGAQFAGGTHHHVLSDVPEDTDVFFVLTRKPLRPEFVGCGKHVYEVETSGAIKVSK